MIKSFILLLIILVIASCSPLSKYKQSAASWESDIKKLEHLDSIENYTHNAVLFTGSSSIRLWSTIKEDMAPYEVIQRGYGGAKFSDYVVYAKRLIYPHQVKAIVIFIANDITGSPQDKTPEEVTRLFQYTVKTIRSKYPETPVFYIQVTPTSSRWKAWPVIQQGNDKVKELCSRLHKVYFIETAKPFLKEDGTPNDSYFRSDKLHLNNEGYKVWAGIIKSALDKELK